MTNSVNCRENSESRTPTHALTSAFKHDALQVVEVPVVDSLEAQIGKYLLERNLKLALAESCTGGLVGNRITDQPGSSEYFLGSLVVYAYTAKVSLLDVSWDTLNGYGAVSREVVLEMARGARRALGSDIAVSVSGIAGPGGGTEEKPVGTTWIALVTAEGEWANQYLFSGDRLQNKSSAADAALRLLLDYLSGNLEKPAV